MGDFTVDTKKKHEGFKDLIDFFGDSDGNDIGCGAEMKVECAKWERKQRNNKIKVKCEPNETPGVKYNRFS